MTSRVINSTDIAGFPVSYTANTTWSGSDSATNCPIFFNYAVSGTSSGAVDLNYISLTSDTITAGTHLVNALTVNHNFGGSGATGGFNGINVIANQTATTANTDGNYVSGLFVAQGSTNDGGTGTGTLSKGELYGFNSNTRLLAAATNWKVICGGEFDTSVVTGGSVDHKRGIAIVQTTSDGVAGSADDAALAIANQAAAGSGTPGWSFGIAFGQNDGFIPIASTGTLIGSVRHNAGGAIGTVTNGIDFSDFTFTGSAFKSPAFSVSNTGAISAGSLAVTSATAPTNGVFLGGTNEVCINAGNVTIGNFSITTNSTPCLLIAGGPATVPLFATDQFEIRAGNNGQAGSMIRNSSAGNAAQANLILSNSTNQAQAGLYLNGGGFTGGQGANALQLFNTSTAPIVIGTGTEVIKVGSTGAFTANGVVATTMTSLGPAGSHTTVQEWLTITDAAGTVRFIPCY